jgi:elongation factor Ts
MAATIEQIKELREKTGAGVNAVREALEVSKGDLEEALKFLRKKGVAKAEKRKDKVAEQGIFGTYVHTNNKVVTVVEVNCETDFAAKSEDMLNFANDIALHVAAVNPLYIKPEDIPAEESDKVKQTFEKELEGKPEEIKENILKGKMEKYYAEAVLLKQNFFSDDSKTVEDHLNELIAKIGEKIAIKSFTKFEIAQKPVSC